MDSLNLILFMFPFLIVFLFTNFDSKSHLAFDSLTFSCCESLDCYFHPGGDSVILTHGTILYTMANLLLKSNNTDTSQTDDDGDVY